jgi:hypothetical protein
MRRSTVLSFSLLPAFPGFSFAFLKKLKVEELSETLVFANSFIKRQCYETISCAADAKAK